MAIERSKKPARRPIAPTPIAFTQGATRVQMNHCSSPLATKSLALALAAELRGDLDMLEGELLCECGAHVGAMHKPHLDGPNGGSLYPTPHSPSEPPRPPATKRDYSKSVR